MKWLKKTLNKWFFQNDEMMEEYEEYDHHEIEEELQEHTYEKEQQRPKFRFPLIPDEELQRPKNEFINQPIDTKNNFPINNGPQQEKGSLIYDVEVSRIHELLEMRIQNKKKSASSKHKVPPRYADRLLEKENKREPVQKKKEQPAEKEKVQMPVNRRRFIPTDVPSPVYGFQKPQPINALLAKKRGTNEQENPDGKEEVSATIEKSPGTLVVEELDKQIEKVKEEVEQILHQTKESMSISIEEGEFTDAPSGNVEKDFVENGGSVPILVETPNEETVKAAQFSDEWHAAEEHHDRDSETIGLNDVQEEIDNPLYEEEDEEYSPSESVGEWDVPPLPNEQVQPDFPGGSVVDDGLDQQEEAGVEQEQQEQPSPVEADPLNEKMDPRTEDFSTALEDERFHVSDNRASETMEAKTGGFSHGEATVHLSSKEDSDEGSHPASLQESSAANDNQTRKKPIPFNVIMLKSDKEKLAKRMQWQTGEKNQHNHNGLTEKKVEIELKNHENTLGSEIKGENAINPFEHSTQADDQSGSGTNRHETLNEPAESNESHYIKPPLSYLTPPETSTEDYEWMESQAEKLVETLSYFQVSAKVESIMQGPAVTQFEITVGHGTKVSKIRNLADDLKLALAAKDIRIQAPIPGKNTIGIEIPNRISRAVRLSEVANSEQFLNSDSPLEAALGLDLTGTPVTIDLRKMPHGLIAGATGSGKSVCINSILVSLLLKAEPSELRLMLIDPKVVELAPYNHIPHLVSPVITDVKAATAALKWAVDEMERRYQLFAHAGVRDLPRYNRLVEQEGKLRLKLPYILIVIDELADLMMMAPHDVEESICRIAQKARACGIHLIVATQRPSVDVITGLIKSNIPTRIAFSVSSQIDSRTILDSQGAERLLGRGDMLYLGNGMSDPIRLQGTFVTDDEIEAIIQHVKEQGEPDYFFEQEELLKKVEMVEEQDELFEDVCRFVFEQGAASTSLIQRKYHIGYNRAARLIEMLESYGFVSEQKGSKPREVYITESDLAELFD